MKYLLLNGGGMDSLAVARMMREYHPNDFIQSLTICTGLPNEPRLRPAAEAISAKYCDLHDEVHLTHGTGVKAELGMPLVGHLFGVPFYCLLMLSIGMSYGMRRGFDVVVSGMKTDTADAKYLPAFQQVLNSSVPTMGATSKPPKLLTPLYGTDNNTVFQSIADDSLLNQTVSCNRATSCGICGKCTLRFRLGVLV